MVVRRGLYVGRREMSGMDIGRDDRDAGNWYETLMISRRRRNIYDNFNKKCFNKKSKL